MRDLAQEQSGAVWFGAVSPGAPQLRSYFREVDERLGNRGMLELFSVSQFRGVIPRGEIADTEGRADSFTKYKVVRKGDIVLNRFNAYRGSLGIAPGAGIVSPDYAVIRPIGADPRYFDYLFRSDEVSNFMKSTMGGIGAQDPDSSGFSRIDLHKLVRLPVPFREEIRRVAVADFLDRETAKIDALIAKQEQLITTLDERRQAVVSHTTKASLSHQVESMDWRLAPLKSLVVAQTGGTPDSSNEDYWSQDGTPWVAIGDMSAVSTVTSTERKVSDLGLEQKKLKTGKPGTVLFAMYASVGATSMLGIEAVWNQAILGLTPKPATINNRFLQFSLEGNREMWKLWSNSNTQENLNQQSVLNARIALPSYEEQLRIVQFLEGFERKSNQLRSTAERVIVLLKERRQALISAAVTGKLEVSDGYS